jgi:hypothetical protein
LIAQKSPTTSQTWGGRPGASILFLTVIAEAEALPNRSAAKLIKASFIMRMRFLHTLYSLSQARPGGILVQLSSPTSSKPLNLAETG